MKILLDTNKSNLKYLVNFASYKGYILTKSKITTPGIYFNLLKIKCTGNSAEFL